jgi:2Fe-2S ferredoxin
VTHASKHDAPQTAELSTAHPDRTVVVKPSGISFITGADETIMTAALRHGLRWPTVCQGNAECAVCTFSVSNDADNLSPIEKDEQACLSGYVRPVGANDAQTFRLACRARVLHGSVEIIKRGVRHHRQAES